MSNRAPADTLGPFIDSLRIVDVAQALGLNPRGRPPKVLCPFHEEKTPSLQLFTAGRSARQHFYCFGCQAHGDSVTLVQRVQNSSFRDAVESAARMCGLEPPVLASPDPVQKNRLSGLALFRRWTQTNPRRREAVAAFAQLRRLKYDTLDACGAGFASSADVREWIKSLTEEERKAVFATGLVTERFLPLTGPFPSAGWDADRIVFPITNPNGALLGFALRATDEAADRRWWFSPGLEKSRTFFLGDATERRIRSARSPTEVWVVEGIADALRLQEAGLHAVACLGASISTAQLSVLEAWAGAASEWGTFLQVHLFPDADRAGRESIRRNLPSVLRRTAVRPELRVDVVLPSPNALGKDPDELLRDVADPARVARGWVASSAAAVTAMALGTDAGTVPAAWEASSRGQRLQAQLEVLQLVERSGERLSLDRVGLFDRFVDGEVRADEGAWARSIREFVEPRRETKSVPQGSDPSRGDAVVEGLMRAFSEARASVLRLEFPPGEGEWDRINGLRLPWSISLARQLEVPSGPPVHLGIWVAKDDGNVRLKALPPPEELIVQHYVLRTLLQSPTMPAVRWSSIRSPRLFTTGPSDLLPAPGGSGVVSFGYVVDDDVVHGRAAPERSGIFRHYWHCYQRFLSFLEQGLLRLRGSRVWARRLDVRGFYDALPRRALEEVRARLTRSPGVIPVVDGLALDEDAGQKDGLGWLLDRSFGYRWTDPATGLVEGPGRDGDSSRGIPQGPDLSAWLANIALFPMDRLATTAGNGRCVYARYVDDIILLSDDSEVVSAVQSAIESELARLGMTLSVSKADHGDGLDKARASGWLREGRGTAGWASEVDNPDLVPSPEELTAMVSGAALPSDRRLALSLLHSDVFDRVGNWDERRGVLQAAFRADGLRHGDLVVASARVWTAISALGGRPGADWAEAYWTEWVQVGGPTTGKDGRLHAVHPLLIALEGLQRVVRARSDRRPDVAPDDASWWADRGRLLAEAVEAGLVESLIKGKEGRWSTDDVIKVAGHMVAVLALDLSWTSAMRLSDRGALRESGERRGFDVASLLTGERSGAGLLARSRNYYPHYLQRRVASLLAAVCEEREPDWRAADQDSYRPEAAWTIVHRIVAAVERWQPDQPGVEDPVERFAAFIDLLRPPILPLLSALRVTSAAPAGVAPSDERAARLLLFGAAKHHQFIRLLVDRPFLLPGSTTGLLPPIPRVSEPGLLAESQLDPGVSISTIVPSGRDAELLPLGVVASEQQTEPLVRKELHFPSLRPLPPRDRGAPLWNEPGALSEAANLASKAFDWLSGNGGTAARMAFSAHHFLADADGILSPLGFLVPEASAPAAGAAFLRRGRGRENLSSLIRKEVPSAFWTAWALGVALADHQGFADAAGELGTARLTAPSRGSRDTPEDLRRELLTLFYRRIGGTRTSRRLAPQFPGGAVPCLVYRNIRRLARAGAAAEDREALRYHLLLAEVEGTALRVRVDEPDLTAPGAAASVLASIARAAVLSQPAALGDVIPDEVADAPKRRHSWAYWSLAERVRKLTASAAAQEDAVGRMELSVFEAGLRVLYFQSELRALVLEALDSGGGPAVLDLSRDPPPLSELGLSEDAFLITSEEPRGADTSRTSPSGSALVLARLAGALGTEAPTAVPDEATTKGSRHWRPEAGLAEITALGWCYALAALSGLLSPTSPRAITLTLEGAAAAESTLDLLRAVAKALSAPASDGEEFDLPWGDLADAARAIHEASHATVGALRAVEELAGIQVTLVEDGVRAPSESMTPGLYSVCAKDHDYALPAWRRGAAALEALGGRQSPTEYTVDAKTRHQHYVWSESRRGGVLVGIGVIDLPFSELLRGNRARATSKPAATDVNSSITTPADADGAASIGVTAYSTATLSDPQHQPVEGQRGVVGPSEGSADENRGAASTSRAGEPSRADPAETGTGGTRQPSLEGRPPSTAAGGEPSAWERVRSAQRQSWLRRRRFPEERGTKLRIAFAQVDVDESYRHPVFEVCAPELGAKPNRAADAKIIGEAQSGRFENIGKLEDGYMPSCAEARRRRLLAEVFRACESFEVDTLVLPELSVRPETLEWIADPRTPRSFDVLAGTCRVPPGHRWKRPSPIPGCERYNDWDALAAYLPSKMREGSPGASFRRKVLPSVAMNEIFRPTPNGETWAFPTTGSDSQSMDPTRWCVALICAELFLVTHPATLAPAILADKQLRRLFGGDPAIRHGNYLQELLKALGDELNILKGMDRRSIVLVPAMTSRAPDYWFAAQSGVLSAGLVTVMCNATKRTHGCGQSFLAGAGSWSARGDAGPGVPQGGPYLGPRPGLLAPANPRDMGALSEHEQAVVIVDVDPIHTVDTMPKFQLPIRPLEYVAHLPIFEDGRVPDTEAAMPWGAARPAKCRCGRQSGEGGPGGKLTKLLDNALQMQDRSGFSWVPVTRDIARAAHESEITWHSLRDRLASWDAHHRADRSGQPPPTAVDWLWVQRAAPDRPCEDIFVPRYTEAPGETAEDSESTDGKPTDSAPPPGMAETANE